MAQHYSDPARADDPHALPDIETFYAPIGENGPHSSWNGKDDIEGGWYWWPCFPGCLPDGDPVGPFATEAEALANARKGVDPMDASKWVSILFEKSGAVTAVIGPFESVLEADCFGSDSGMPWDSCEILSRGEYEQSMKGTRDAS